MAGSLGHYFIYFDGEPFFCCPSGFTGPGATRLERVVFSVGSPEPWDVPPDGFYAGLDDIQITQVPEPSLAMGQCVGGLLLWVLYRRRASARGSRWS